MGYSGAPRTLGFDESGRHIVEYVEGDVLMPFEPRDPISALHRVGKLLREFHDAAATFVPPNDAKWNVVIPPDQCDIAIHHDSAPWNLVVGADRWMFTDWDNAGPGSRLWDLSYAAHGFLPLDRRCLLTTSECGLPPWLVATDWMSRGGAVSRTCWCHAS